jgi:hypothetical protein
MTKDTQNAQTVSQAAKAMAFRRKSRNWLAIGFGGSVFLNVAIPIWDGCRADHRQQVVVLDMASGTMLLAPIVDPANSTEIIERSSLWAAQCLFDRSALGFRHPELIKLMFNSDALKQARQEVDREARESQVKSLVSTVDVLRISAQHINHGLISAQMNCKIRVSGKVNGEDKVDDRFVTVNFQFAQNDDLIHRPRYPLMVVGYSYPSINQTAQK